MREWREGKWGRRKEKGGRSGGRGPEGKWGGARRGVGGGERGWEGK